MRHEQPHGLPRAIRLVRLRQLRARAQRNRKLDILMISSDEQFMTEHRVAMNVRAMRDAIADLLDMAGTTYGLPYVMRDSRDLESLADDLEQLILLLEYNRLKKVS